MATQQEKIYRISIQTDAAQQAVEAARKKLAELDAQLEGIDKNSDAGRAIVAAMDKLVGEVEAAEGRVEGLTDALDNLKPGTLPALRAEIEELEKELDQTVRGTAEFDAALLKLGNKKGELKALDDAIDALDPKMKAAAFVDFANGVVGAFTIATTAAQNFGLSKETAEAYQQKLLSLIAVMDGVEQVSRALNSETLSVVKSTYAAAKGYLGMGEAAAEGSRVTRAALISTGIGLLIVAVALLVANFDKVKAVAADIRARFKPEFDAVGNFLDALAAKARNLGSLLTFGLIDDAAKHAAKVSAEFRQKELTLIVEHTARLIEIQKARGVDTLALEVDNAKRRLETLKNSTADEKKVYADARKDYLVLAAQYEKQLADDTRAARLAHLNALAAAETARGASTFASQLAAKKEQIAQLAELELAGQRVTQAQKIQLQSELDALVLARDKELADKRAALQGATLAAQLVRLQASTTEQSLVEVEANSKQIEIVKQHRATLLAQAQVDKAAVVAADADLYKLRLDRSRIFYRQEAEQAQAVREEYTRAIDALRAKDAASEAQYQANLNRAQQAGARVTKQIADELAAELQLKVMKAATDADIGGNLLIRLFGLTDAQAQSLKGRLAEVAANVGGLVAAMMAGATADADAALTDAQARLSQLSEQLSAASAQRQSDEAALQSATGARREYLLGKIQKEQAAESKLAAEKQKAAREEQAAQKEKARLELLQQRLTATSTLLTNSATAATAIKAGVEAVAGANAVPFPGNLVAIVAALAATGAAIASAKGLANTFADGGFVDGPSHAAGGIQMWHRSGAHLGEMEGGEFIVNRRSAAAHRPLLEMINDVHNTRVLPHPTGRFASGGVAPTSGGLPAGMVAVQQADLAQLVATNQAMLAHLQTVAAATSATAGYGPARFNIGPFEALQIEEQKQQAAQAQEHATL